MNKIKKTFIVLLFLSFVCNTMHADEQIPQKKNAVIFNFTGCFVNEINIGFEHYFNQRKSLEVNGGLIFINNFLKDNTKDWKNAQVFLEHGYALRVHYKLYSRVEDETKKWRDYVSPGLIFKNLYYNEQWFTNELTSKHGLKYFQRVLESRTRTKIGFEFLWGKIFAFNNSISFEFFYGGGVNGTFVQKNDLKIIPDANKNIVLDENIKYNVFYVSPMVSAGIKLKIRF